MKRLQYPAAMNSHGSRSLMEITGILASIFILIAVGLVSVVVTAGSSSDVDGKVEALTALERLEREYGIEVIALRRTAADYMLDLRYRVTDPEKASITFTEEIKPYLIHDDDGMKLTVPSTPKVGDLRHYTSNPRLDRTYFMFFANPGKNVQAGDTVTLVMGDAEFRKLVVE